MIPENVLKRMNPEERRKLGKAGRTLEECSEARAINSEKELQRQCIALIKLHGVHFVDVAAMHKKTTARIGTPDLRFSFPRGRNERGIPVAIECKLPGQNPTLDQITVMREMRWDGWMVETVHTAEEMRAVLHALETI